ncbi:MAG: hypothetical protein AB1942_03550 [Pseudomonadota bacterium]|jgi:hypothetical protein|uniref:Uncharacterized protein n=1 Tax=Phenylobacterium kunshanense TaxID=1445034 RepID=A0A328BRW3_9CAUL|nr:MULTISPECIES: hypothetical protein [Phenylobacterium]OHB26278.1 MAG: hypothetical protein A2790_20145 [Phenylobacterium sp. RIFCSPHIGHO2_01_FULL_69_31]PZQ59428.1 MAG: hypothetical protein DI570_16100 [Phenylobacterium zucineum]RAK67808.1 hypothetical protein DJ019_07885 [Phenylobacterium kunshanense]
MGLTTLSGAVSGIRHSTETRGTFGRNGGSVKTGQVIAFRVGERSAQIKLADVPDLRDGDEVTLAGREKNGVFKALALRNDKTRAVYSIPTTVGYLMGATLIALGLMTLFILVGVVFIAGGMWTLYEAYNYTQAANMLRA